MPVLLFYLIFISIIKFHLIPQVRRHYHQHPLSHYTTITTWQPVVNLLAFCLSSLISSSMKVRILPVLISNPIPKTMPGMQWIPSKYLLNMWMNKYNIHHFMGDRFSLTAVSSLSKSYGSEVDPPFIFAVSYPSTWIWLVAKIPLLNKTVYLVIGRWFLGSSSLSWADISLPVQNHSASELKETSGKNPSAWAPSSSCLPETSCRRQHLIQMRSDTHGLMPQLPAKGQWQLPLHRRVSQVS